MLHITVRTIDPDGKMVAEELVDVAPRTSVWLAMMQARSQGLAFDEAECTVRLGKSKTLLPRSEWEKTPLTKPTMVTIAPKSERVFV